MAISFYILLPLVGKSESEGFQMFFKPALYMEAVKEMDFSSVECNLAFSGIVCPFSLAELGVTAKVLEKGDHHAYGNPDLKEEIARKYGVRPDQVLVPGGGSSLCNFLFAAALLKPGEQALVETPTYEPLLSTIASTGAQIVALPRPAGRGFDIDFDEFCALMHPPVKLAVLTRLHNPSGKDISVELLRCMGQKAEEIGAYVLVDEVYLDFLPADKCPPAALIHPRLITTSSLTKVYGLGDLRLGWGIAPADLIWQCWRINNVLGVVPPAVPDQIALELFQGGGLERILTWAKRRSREHWAIVEQFLSQIGSSASNRFGLQWVKPDEGIFVFVRLTDGGEADKFAAYLKDKYRTLIMPGRYFDQGDGFRLGFGTDPDELREGLKRIGLAMKEFQR